MSYYTSNNNNSNTSLLTSSNYISSLSNVDVKKSNKQRAKMFLITMFLLTITIIALIVSIVIVLVKTNETQTSINNMKNSINAIDVQMNNLEKSLDKKYSNIDEYDFEKNKQLDIKYGKALILNDQNTADSSIVLNSSNTEINSFMSVIVNNLQKLWDFLN